MPGQEAGRVPRRAAVAGADEADVGRAAVEEAADLERGDDRSVGANVSGSTSVACWLVGLVNGSALTCVSGTFAAATPAVANSRAATSTTQLASPLNGLGVGCIDPPVLDNLQVPRVYGRAFVANEDLVQRLALEVGRPGAHPGRRPETDMAEPAARLGLDEPARVSPPRRPRDPDRDH